MRHIDVHAALCGKVSRSERYRCGIPVCRLDGLLLPIRYPAPRSYSCLGQVELRHDVSQATAPVNANQGALKKKHSPFVSLTLTRRQHWRYKVNAFDEFTPNHDRSTVGHRPEHQSIILVYLRKCLLFARAFSRSRLAHQLAHLLPEALVLCAELCAYQFAPRTPSVTRTVVRLGRRRCQHGRQLRLPSLPHLVT